MFGCDLEQVKEYLDKIGARYETVTTGDFKQIYVFEKDAYDKKHKHPRKYKDLYVSYLRISCHPGHIGLYTRRDGICGYMTDETVKEFIDRLTFNK